MAKVLLLKLLYLNFSLQLFIYADRLGVYHLDRKLPFNNNNNHNNNNNNNNNNNYIDNLSGIVFLPSVIFQTSSCVSDGMGEEGGNITR